jgi:hypothetical protein
VTSTRKTGKDDGEYVARILGHPKGSYVPWDLVARQIAGLATTLVDPEVRLYHKVRTTIGVLRAGETLAQVRAGYDLETRW